MAVRDEVRRLFGPNKIQRPININAYVPPNLPTLRSLALDSEELDRSRVIGSGSLAQPHGTPHSLLNFAEAEPAFHHYLDVKANSVEAQLEQRIPIIQALNGIVVEPRIASEEEFASEYRCTGISTRSYIFDDPQQMPHGIAIMTSGAIDIVNNSLRTWLPGQRLVFRSPSFDRRMREQEREAVGKIEGENPRRIRFIIEPLEYVDAKLYFEQEFTKSFHEGLRASYHVDRLLGSYNDTPAQRAAGYFRNFVAFTAWATIAAVSQVSIAAFADIARLRFSDDQTLRAEGAGGVTGREAYNLMVQGLDTMMSERASSMTDDERKQLDDYMRLWQSMLGLMPSTADPTRGGALRPAYGLVDKICGIVGRTHIMDAVAAEHFDLLQLFPKDLRAAAMTRNGRFGTKPNVDNRLGALCYYQAGLTGGFIRGCKQSIERLANRYVGTVLERTEPRQKGNILRSH